MYYYSLAVKKVENVSTANVTFKIYSSFSCYMRPLQNKCVPYWPTTEGESREAGRYVVTLLSEKDATDYKVRVMELTAPHRVRKQSLHKIPLCKHSH